MKPLQHSKLCFLLITMLFMTGCSTWNNSSASRWMKCALLGGTSAGIVGAARSATAAGLGFAGGALIGGTLCAFADRNHDGNNDIPNTDIPEPQQKFSKVEEKPVSIQPIAYKAGSILFAFDSSEISSQAKEVLEHILQLLNDEPNSVLSITGYTDNIGTPEYNWPLSQRRANAVKDYLDSHGINPNRITAEGAGIIESNNETLDGKIKNRKADITVHRPYTQ